MTPQELADIARRHREAWVESQPFVLGLMGDFSGRTRDELPPLKDRRFQDVQLDTVDTLMASMLPVARIDMDDPARPGRRIGHAIEFRRLADFEPEALLQRVPPLATAATELAALAAGSLRDQRAKALSAQLDSLLQAAPVRGLDARWRSLHRLLMGLPDLPSLRVRVLDLSRNELDRVLKYYRGSSWSSSPLYHHIVSQELGTWGGQPFNLLIGDYAFTNSPADISCLGDLAAIAGAADCVCLAAAAPRLLGLSSHAQAPDLRAPGRLFQAATYASWHALRADRDANRLALALPRVVARPPHRSVLHGAGGMLYEEAAADAANLPWANAAYVVGGRLFADVALRAGRGGLPDAPTGGVMAAGAGWPTAHGQAVEGRFEQPVLDELLDLGLLVVEQARGSENLRYAAARSLAAGPPDYLAWRMLCGRLMHGLRDLVRQLRGAARTESDHVQAMRAWLRGFTDNVDDKASDGDRQALLADAELRAWAIDGLERDREPRAWDGLGVELTIKLPPLRPGRTEHCSANAYFSAEGSSTD